MTKALRRFSKISQDMLGSNFQSQMDEAIKEIDDIIITTLKNARQRQENEQLELEHK